jgi:hypothetical protein
MEDKMSNRAVPPPLGEPPNGDRIHIFGDDSSQTAHDYFVYGSIYLPESKLSYLQKRLKGALGTYVHEIKWNEARYLRENLKFVNALFDCRPAWSYRCIVVKSSEMKMSAGSNSALPRMRAKLIFTHLNTYARVFKHSPEFAVTLDKSEHPPEVHQITLNRNFWKEHGGDYDAFKVRDEESDRSFLLQAADILTGAVAFVTNGGWETSTSKHRRTLAKFIASRAHLPAVRDVSKGVYIPANDPRTLGHRTIREREMGFAIWHVDLAKSKARLDGPAF